MGEIAKEKEIIYKCYCMKEEVKISVPFRNEDEDILHWMQTCVQPAIYLDHRKRNAICTRQEMEYAKIYIDESAEGIGSRPHVN